VIEFDVGNGTYGGLYPHASEFISVSDARSSSLKKCFVNANALNDIWSVKITALFNKDNTRTFQLSTNHDGTPDSGATAKALESCASASVSSWPWPSSTAIEGTKNGTGPGYLNIIANTHWVRR
jgi:hypothetical protein